MTYFLVSSKQVFLLFGELGSQVYSKKLYVIWIQIKLY